MALLQLFAKRPVVSHEDRGIVVRNSLITRLCNGFTHLRRVELDPVHQRVKYSSRFFWLFNTRLEVPFADLSHLTYLSGSSETGFSKAAGEGNANEPEDEFSLAFVTKREDIVEICTFSGGKPRRRRSDRTSEDSPAAELVRQLSGLLGIELEPERRSRRQVFIRCPVCRRKISRFASHCIYCKKTGR